jgi:hypothetical protein
MEAIGLVLAFLLVALVSGLGAVRLFQYGILLGRHWNYQEKTQDAPTNPSEVPQKAKPFIKPNDPWMPPAEMPIHDFRSEQQNPFDEPAIGGKDAIPPAPGV